MLIVPPAELAADLWYRGLTYLDVPPLQKAEETVETSPVLGSPIDACSLDVRSHGSQLRDFWGGIKGWSD